MFRKIHYLVTLTCRPFSIVNDKRARNLDTFLSPLFLRQTCPLNLYTRMLGLIKVTLSFQTLGLASKACWRSLSKEILFTLPT